MIDSGLARSLQSESNGQPRTELSSSLVCPAYSCVRGSFFEWKLEKLRVAIKIVELNEVGFNFDSA